MKNIIIIDEYSSSKVNGIGSYMRELIYVLKEGRFSICVVLLNYDCEELSVIKEGEITKIFIPQLPYFHCCKIIDKILRLYIKDSCNNIFLFNHTPLELLIKNVKKKYILSKFTYAIHDMTWTMSFLGDTKKIKKAISQKELGNEREMDAILYDKFREEQRMFELVDVIIVLAQETVDLLRDLYKVNPLKIAFIPNGLRDSFIPIKPSEKLLLRSSLYINENEKIILFVGRIHLVKGIYVLINSFKKVLNKYPNCRLVIIGTIFDFADILKRVNEISSKITITGQIDKKMLNKWYSIADIGVLPSYLEQCSYTGIEMMMNKLPIVASDGFCVKEMFKNNLNASVAEIGDRDKIDIFETNLAYEILDLLHFSEKCSNLGNNGRAVYESTYYIDAMRNKYHSLLGNL